MISEGVLRSDLIKKILGIRYIEDNLLNPNTIKYNPLMRLLCIMTPFYIEQYHNKAILTISGRAV
ncbi:MAG: hypothetical protein ARM1_0603 [Candidatus Micrarchaeota archaeon]|nr:MAG: hypothetical protein ARM1_0603 [Candidatus Micrarchaeota archaeon]